MYSHLTKGASVGAALTRRLGRFTIGLIGLLLDALFIAPLFKFFLADTERDNHNYLDFWLMTENSQQYLDGTIEVGFFRIIFGYIGDIPGAIIGGLVGLILGGLLFIPDALLCTLCWLHNKTVAQLDSFVTLVGSKEYAFFDDLYYVWKDPENSVSKTMNFFAATLGVLLAAVPYLLAKFVEFLVPPLSNSLSSTIWQAGGLIGAVVGLGVGLCLFPAKHICQKAVDLYYGDEQGSGGFRDLVRSIVAFVYAKTNRSTDNVLDLNGYVLCVTGKVAHSKEFRDKVLEYKKDWDVILFGSTSQAMDKLEENKAEPFTASQLSQHLEYEPTPIAPPFTLTDVHNIVTDDPEEQQPGGVGLLSGSANLR